MVRKHTLAILGVALAFPCAATAGTTVASGKEAKPMVEECKESWISGDIGVNVVSQYVSRGVFFENSGGIIQPYADIFIKVYEGDGFLNKITLNIGTWNSFHTARTDNGLASGTPSSTTGQWYESDFTFGTSITFAKYFTFTPSYYVFLSPNDGFATFEGVNLKLAIDDSEWLGAFSLKPTFQVLFELDNKAGSGADQGIYYEVAIAPSLPAFGPVTVSFPITAGFGSDDFYADDGFGYLSAGVVAAWSLGFIPEELGAWTVTAGATYYYLDAGLEDFNTGPDRIRNPSHHEWVFSGGLMIAF
jgi:hypothetical protein